ncbi:MAG: bifunctional phosphopantothenoylcysteine decarboxylase/phosphopantothenate--cysteine ligase CoaBC [Clostridiales bacterium]|nr:bifunctional phosphopantothenoylcysteine decarboxylase/phosphopantothenate--cysteine ligase CoaBC [Clostridiales bacterium]
MDKKTVVLGVTGGIAAYKSAEITSRLRKAGVEVYVIMTKNATEFIAPLTFETLSGHAVAVDMFAEKVRYEVEHISLAKRADVFLIAPATANIIGKMANGIADDMLSTTVMATEAPICIAPAMNEKMWEHPATQQNMATLVSRGAHVVGPGCGILACGDIGYGRMEEPNVIVEAVLDLLESEKPLKGKKVVITAGPTREAIDPVRYISNRSSGKMGVSLAKEARRLGADVTLIHGPMTVSAPLWVHAVPVETTAQMHDAVLTAFEGADILIKAAAPADFTPAESYDFKIKKTQHELDSIRLVETADILSDVAARKKPGQLVIGFAAETNAVLSYAEDKLTRKNLDMIVANDVTQKGAGFDADTNIVTVLKKGYQRQIPLAHKDAIAAAVLQEIIDML